MADLSETINPMGHPYFHMFIHSFRTRYLLWILPIQRNMKHWSNPIAYSYSYRICRICTPVRTNIMLRGYCITNLLSYIPYMLSTLVKWIWGGLSIGKGTLTQFFAFHFILPYIILALVLVHVLILHETGSNNSTCIYPNADKIPFYPYYTIKDTLGLFLIIIILLILAIFSADQLGDSENFTPPNPAT